jgi:hypothetical protein
LHDSQIIMKSEFYIDEISPPVSRAGTLSLQMYVSVLAALLHMTQKCVKFQTLALLSRNMEILNFNFWGERRQGGWGEGGKGTEKKIKP